MTAGLKAPLWDMQNGNAVKFRDGRAAVSVCSVLSEIHKAQSTVRYGRMGRSLEVRRKSENLPEVGCTQLLCSRDLERRCGHTDAGLGRWSVHQCLQEPSFLSRERRFFCAPRVLASRARDIRKEVGTDEALRDSMPSHRSACLVVTHVTTRQTEQHLSLIHISEPTRPY